MRIKRYILVRLILVNLELEGYAMSFRDFRDLTQKKYIYLLS